MASLMAGRVARLVAYVPSLRAAAKQFRVAASTYSSQQMQSSAAAGADDAAALVWPDQILGVLAPHDKRFPLPGRTGSDHQLNARLGGALAAGQRKQAAAAHSASVDDLNALLQSDRHAAVAEHLISTADDEDGVAGLLEEGSALQKVECVIQDCPELLKKRISPLFPMKNISKESLTVITLSQKTDNDMTGWNPDVEEEREALLAEFVEAAQEICKALSEAGYWADFIDPSSGKPYMSAPTNDTLFETDDRYRYFGFEIEDLGCCKVVLHHKWGSKCYVGSVFTDAPSTDQVLNDALGLFKKS